MGFLVELGLVLISKVYCNHFFALSLSILLPLIYFVISIFEILVFVEIDLN